VRICNWQRLHAAVSGNRHPVLGEAILVLDPYLLDLEPRSVVLPMWLSDEHVGLVSLQYQALLLCGPGVVSEGVARAAALAKRPARLRAQVLAVFCLRVPKPLPELTLQELLSSVTGDELLPPARVFAELELGPRSVETTCMQIPSGDLPVQFIDEFALFTYSGEDRMEVRVRSWRWPKELAGEVFVGSGTLKLEHSLDSCDPQIVDLPVSRTGMVTGFVSLRYQLFI